MPSKRPTTISAWQRWCIIVTIVSPDRATAERRLGLTKNQLSLQINNAFHVLKVRTLMQAALKLGLLKVDYERLGDWFEQRTVNVGPGIDLDLEGDSDNAGMDA